MAGNYQETKQGPGKKEKQTRKKEKKNKNTTTKKQTNNTHTHTQQTHPSRRFEWNAISRAPRDAGGFGGLGHLVDQDPVEVEVGLAVDAMNLLKSHAKTCKHIIPVVMFAKKEEERNMFGNVPRKNYKNVQTYHSSSGIGSLSNISPSLPWMRSICSSPPGKQK